MDQPLIAQAIKCALCQNWKEAIRLTLELLRQNEENIEALNRLAYAYLKTGNLPSSKSTYKKVLKINKYNPIAIKNLKWLSNLTKHDIHQDPSVSPTPTIFLEEPGKTKIVILIDPAAARVLCNIASAQKVYLVLKKHRIEVRDGQDVYIGALPDDLSHRLTRFINTGNTYEAYIKNVERNNVSVFIREMKRGKKFGHLPSFSVYNNLTSRTNSFSSDREDPEVPKGDETETAET